ncbi:MAG: trigger factor, partial [Opitutales bacterium]|nr:trigger factor [Opitutales bacterium]
MKTNIENINDTRKKITFSFDAKQIAEENEKVVKDFVRNAKIAGFRPGKAPVNMVTKLYADSIKEQVERSLTSKAIDELNNIKEFDVYAVVDLNKEDKDGEMNLVFTADIYPEVKLPKSLATKVELEATDVKEEEIDNAIEFYRNQRAKYNEVDREIKAGDFIRLAYTGTIDGESVQALAPEMPLYADQKSTWEEAGNKEAPGIQGVVQGIIGMKKGEKKIVSHEFPKDVKNDKIAGKTAQYEVEIFDIREKELPELNEEFFKSFDVDSLEKLREKVKANIEGEKKSNNEVLKRQFAVEQLMEKCDFALPESAVEDERQSILEEMMMRFMSQGASREDIEKNKEALFDSAGKEAEGRAKMRIFLNRVAKANDLKIDNEDMSRMLWQEAMRTRSKPEELIKQLRKDPARANRMR